MSLGFHCPASSVKLRTALIEGCRRRGKTMTVFVIRGALGAMLVATSSWASAQALNVRAGAWDMTMSLAINGGAPKVSPLKSCVTKEDLERDQAFQKDEDCSYKISARTPTRLAGTATCKNDQMQSRGEFEIVAASPETIVMKVASKGSNAKGGAVETRMELKGRWASPSCKGYDD
jgi:Protein of unknown function (DUF3617)